MRYNLGSLSYRMRAAPLIPSSQMTRQEKNTGDGFGLMSEKWKAIMRKMDVREESREKLMVEND